MAGALKNAGFAVIVSGDPCYGACDLALDTLDHADVLVHFGHAPVDDQDRVIFLPYEVDFDVAVLENALPLLKGKTTGLVTTVQHVHLIPAMEAFLKARGIDVRVAEGKGRTPLPGTGARLLFYHGKGSRGRPGPLCRHRALPPDRHCPFHRKRG